MNSKDKIKNTLVEMAENASKDRDTLDGLCKEFHELEQKALSEPEANNEEDGWNEGYLLDMNCERNFIIDLDSVDNIKVILNGHEIILNKDKIIMLLLEFFRY